MEKLKMQTPNITEQNMEQIAKLFPNVMTETQDKNGEVQKAIDFDLLKQSLSSVLVDDDDERYRLDWPGKKAALLKANTPVTKTLRPCRDDSVNFDNTENVYIEGDNFEVLKILQESYLGKIKMIYIDPPYNTGKDFIYKDNFTAKKSDYEEELGITDEEDNKLFKNTYTNGRFHSDWLSMMYERLVVAKDLLKEDGIIFISINDKEVHNLREICDEIFGEDCFIACLIWDKNHSAQAGVFKAYHEYIFVYAKNIELIDTPTTGNGDLFEAGAMKRESGRHPMSEFTFPAGVRFNANEGTELIDNWGGIEKVELLKGRMISFSGVTKEEVTLKAAYTQKNQMKQYFYGDRDSLLDSRGQKITEFYFTAKGKIKIVKERGVETPQTTLNNYGSQGVISTAFAKLFKLSQTPFDNPKPIKLIKDFTKWFVDEDSTTLDFFSGSATTAHAVMQLNAEDNGNRKFIMVQLPEATDEKSEAYKAGYKTITEIGKERILRAGKKIVEDNQDKAGIDKLDIGFRVYKTDSSNMKEVYYHPEQLTQDDIFSLESNIKKGRKPDDLLTQVILDLGLELNLPIEQKEMHGNNVFIVQTNALVACFDLGKIKMIYIDPPYNTGKDFIYKDNFAAKKADYEEELGTTDEEENKLFRNTDTNGRFHSDWLSMMYERLVVARDLLTEDGVIFISIDDNEVHNLRGVCDEVFGEENFLIHFSWRTDGNFDNQAKFKKCHEYILSYAKDEQYFLAPPVIDPSVPNDSKLYKNEIINTIVKNGPKNPVSSVVLPKGFPANIDETIIEKRVTQWPHYSQDAVIKNGKLFEEVEIKSGWSSKSLLIDFIKNKYKVVTDIKGQSSRFVISPTGAIEVIKERSTIQSHVISSLENLGGPQKAGAEIKSLEVVFDDYPKPVELVQYLCKMIYRSDDIILDFFSGSATTAHAVMQLNAEDNGNRKFIMVQLPEATDEKSEAYKAGYKNIAEIGKERIRRAGTKIVEDNQNKIGIDKLDIGFRVYKTGSS
ncbi:site-specific DNA-methyltransferase, partial [Bathymodiolus platifrons methanotrophic gill symbiont]|uniref:site-specific DNA-methyltransferase n=1 Tax=Bathymodiolus platifrons methanotrophic gill symbiont TaxID=113268 RepID=UPI0027D8DB34